jgi:hypothetical protein
LKASLAVVSDRAVVLGDEISIVMCDARHQFWDPALSHGYPPGLWARRGSLLQSRIGRSKARYGLVAHCQLFVIGDPAGFHHLVKAFFQPLDSTI